MDAITFTCQYCGQQQEWETRESANLAASWHLYDDHPLRWLTVAGHRPPMDPRPRRARHWADRPQRPRWHQRKYPHREHGSSQDVRTFVSPLVDKPWSARVDGHPVDTPAV